MKEDEIRKRDVFNKYLELAREDASRFLADSPSFVSINCPACDCSDVRFEFDKQGFKYVSCVACSTLFVNPRPSFEALKGFYTDSPSMRFLIDKFFKPVIKSRRERIFRPRAEYVNRMFPDRAGGLVGDIGAGFGVFLEELSRLWPTAKLIAIEPSPAQADICRSRGLEVRCCALEEVEEFRDQFDLLTAFELAEHLFDPEDFFNKVHDILKPGGHLLISTLNACGFDIQLLWGRSKGLNPPHHLNFFNPKSMSTLLRRCGFETVDISTPGNLDWDIVEGMIKHEKVDLGRFWGFLAENGTKECKADLQEWISKYNLSSHMRAVAKKPLKNNG